MSLSNSSRKNFSAKLSAVELLFKRLSFFNREAKILKFSNEISSPKFLTMMQAKTIKKATHHIDN